MIPVTEEVARAVPAEPRRGEGAAMAAAVFRDPDHGAAVAALQLRIARTLVNAPALPVALPAFDLTLLSVTAERRVVALVLGKDAPIARLRLSDRGAAATGEAAPVEVATVELHESATRFRPQLHRIAERLRRAITRDKWRAALESAHELAALPVGVPLAFYRQLVPGTAGQALVRTGFNCNQDCGICWQDRTWGRYGAAQTRTWIEDLRRAGARNLIISGGEPTLDHALADYIRHARAIGFEWVTLETNAIQFAKPGLAEQLRDAGLGDCFVSLHSGDAATSDAITRAPGTFLRTVAGIRRLLAAGVAIRLNCVMTAEGLEHLEQVPEFVHRTFGSDPHLQALMFSQPCDPFDTALLPAIVPDPARLRLTLRRALDRAFALGVPVAGLDGPCGPPLCAFGADRRITSLTPVPESIDGRVYLDPCRRCAVRHACFGVRAADAALYGAACVAPFASVPPA
jgi:pyruvate-formate lyase-activating enzyme